MIPLPIDRNLGDIVASLARQRSLVIVAPPGAGKTTRVAPALLGAGLLERRHPNLVMLQPRRVAARAAALRIADERGWRVGREVGYHVRFDRKIGPETRLRVLTEGILTRQLLDDPLLEGVGGVILDEFHERSLNTDLAIALLREVQQARPDLLLVVMSATLEAEPVARYLGDCPVVRSQGRLYPVAVTHAPGPSGEPIDVRAARAAAEALGDRDGDVLVFLPGAEEIRRSMVQLQRLGVAADVLPLYGALSVEEQVRAIEPDPGGGRRIICATNIAETSLTIGGVRTVVDSGLERIAGYDAQRGLDRLELARISQASAVQRAGRAGRVGPGRCVRLYTAKEFFAMAPYALPEIARVDLAQTVLALHAWGRTDVRRFGWYQAPPEAMVASAERLLVMLGALSAGRDGRITPLGQRLLAVPAHPRLARLMLAAVAANLAYEGATLAALLSEKDILPAQRRERGHIDTGQTQGRSDLLTRMEALARAQREGFGSHLRDAGIDPATARRVARLRDELLVLLPGRKAPHPRADETALLRATLTAYPDRVCRRRANDPTGGTMVGGGGVRLSAESVVHQGEFFVAPDARRDERNPRAEAAVRIAGAIEESWLEELFPGAVRLEQAAEFDAQRQRVVGIERAMYRDLALRERRGGEVSAELATQTLRQALVGRTDELLADEPWLTELFGRLEFLWAALPERARPASDLSAADGPALLAEACVGARSVAQVKANLRGAVDARLSYADRRLLDEQAPETIAVPTGNRIRLDWSAARARPQVRGPVLAVRLQELFGLARTPSVAGGTVPVVLHLLGPNYRPVQVTDDLASFWRNTYPLVRKDLRARYPKHSWPEDPLSAPPRAKGGRRR